MVSNTEKINNLRNNALMSALDALVKFCDPSNTDCGVSPEAREEAKSYLESWAVGPLAAALRMKDLGAWERTDNIQAGAEYLDLLDDMDRAYAGRS